MKPQQTFAVIFYVFIGAHESWTQEDVDLSFPENFLIGAATSAYQIEGAWNTSGKSESAWDYLVHNYPDRIKDHSTADVACDSYHKYKEDIRLMKEIGLDSYRFSMSWTRILPTGHPDYINPDGLRYYHDLLDELEKHNIKPIVTICHTDHPQIFETYFGGWLDERMAFAFAEYAKVVFREFAHRVKIFATINEPWGYCKVFYSSQSIYPNKRNTTGWGEYHCLQNMLKGHALAYHAYDTEYRKLYNGKVGIVIPMFYFFPKNDSDTETGDIAFEFQAGTTAHPIYSKEGDYPKIVKERVAARSKAQGLKRSRFPELSKFWIEYIKGTADFFGLNHYTSVLVEPLPYSDILNWSTDDGLVRSVDSTWPMSESPWLKVVPQGFRGALRKIKEKYNNPVVYVTENGVSDGNGTNDDLRMKYLRSYMREMLLAIKRDGCNVQAYTIWSLLDNFEWNSGYTQHFGIVKVDFNDINRTRTLKKSVSWLRDVIRARKLL